MFFVKKGKILWKRRFFIENRYTFCQKRVYHCSRPSELYGTEFKPTCWALFSCCGVAIIQGELPTTCRCCKQIGVIIIYNISQPKYTILKELIATKDFIGKFCIFKINLGSIRPNSARFGSIRFNSAQFGPIQFNSARFGQFWF